MALADLAIRNAKPGLKPIRWWQIRSPRRLPGGKLWRLKYRLDGKEKQLATGSYPAISLSKARERRDEARAILAAGKDSSREKVRGRSETQNAFSVIAAEYVQRPAATASTQMVAVPWLF